MARITIAEAEAEANIFGKSITEEKNCIRCVPFGSVLDAF